MKRLAAVLLALACPAAASPQTQATARDAAQPPVLTATVVARHPHDDRAFTQGLLWRDGALYESTGKEGRSEVRRVRLADGKVLARARLPTGQFGEGLAAWKDELVSLTWKDGIAHRWNAETLEPVGESRYPGEGWGLTSDGVSLILSDGSSVLRVLDPVSFAERRRIRVHLPDGRRLSRLNELEWVDGAILANIWMTGFIARIDPASGEVTAWIDLRPLVAEIGPADIDAVLNGIAWDARERRLFVTGKLWPTLFEITLDPGRAD